MDLKSVTIMTLLTVILCVAALLFVSIIRQPDNPQNEKSDSKDALVSDSPSQILKQDLEKSESGKENPAAEKKTGEKKSADEKPLVLVDENQQSENQHAKMPDETEKPQNDGGMVENEISAEQSPENEKFLIPVSENHAKICFVIDDGGLSVENVKLYASLPFPLTIAVLPRLAYSKECAGVVVDSGKELILHQPMQAHDWTNGKTPDPGEGAILPGMPEDLIKETVLKNIGDLDKKIKGLNNHEGSLITEDKNAMASVLSVAEDENIYFLDSRTTASTCVPSVAKEKNMKYIARFAPFLDNEVDYFAMLEQLYKGLAVANRDGYAIIIGHVDKSAKILPNLLKEIYPELLKKGYILTTPSDL